jgi:hypothetical protein
MRRRTSRSGLVLGVLLAMAASLVTAASLSAAPPHITLEVTATPSQIGVGNDVLLHAVITNSGGGTATHVRYKVDAPAGAVVKEASSLDGSCTVAPAEAVCNLVNLPAGAVATAAVRITAGDVAGAMVFESGNQLPPVHLVSVTVDESDNDDPDSGGKTDTFFPSAPLSVGVRDDEDFAGGCLDDGTLLTTDQGAGLSETNPVITTTSVVGTGGGLCTSYTIEEVDDPPTSTVACPPGAKCKMPQYVDVLFPTPAPGSPVSITVQTAVKTRTIYVDGVQVAKCPRRGTIIEGKCLKTVRSLSGGGTEFTLLVASDIRIKG